MTADRTAPIDRHDLELLAWSCALTDRDADMVAIGERLYQGWCEAGDPMRAARWAFWIGFRSLAIAEMGRASGWLSRAQRLVDREGAECVVSGHLLLPLIRRHLAAGEHDAAYDTAASAAAIGERFGEPDSLSYARQMQGQILLRRGRIEEGLTLLDEVMLAVRSGELSPVMTGIVYCGAIGSCQRVYAIDRAREWTTALAAWCSAQPQIRVDSTLHVRCTARRSWSSAARGPRPSKRRAGLPWRSCRRSAATRSTSRARSTDCAEN